jgi:hypothetical protein
MSILLKEAQTRTTMRCNVKLAEIELFLKGTTLWVWGDINHGHIRRANEVFRDNVCSDVLLQPGAIIMR